MALAENFYVLPVAVLALWTLMIQLLDWGCIVRDSIILGDPLLFQAAVCLLKT